MSNKKLLAIHQGALGDVVTSFTSLLLLRAVYSQIDIACRHSTGLMAKYLKVIDCSFSLESAAFSYLFNDDHFSLNSQLTKFLRSYNDIILFSFSMDLAENIKNITSKRVFQIPPRPISSEPIHVGIYLISQMVQAKLLNKEAQSNFFEIYQDFRNPDRNKRKIVIHPGSGSHLKNWPLKHFLKLEKLLSDDGFEIVFILGPAEEGLAEIILKNGTLSKRILQLFDPIILIKFLKSCEAFIGNDSGIAHLAAFMGLPALVIFGPTSPFRWQPMGRQVETIRAELDCNPCFENLKRGCESMECLSSLSPEQVRKKFHAFKG